MSFVRKTKICKTYLKYMLAGRLHVIKRQEEIFQQETNLNSMSVIEQAPRQLSFAFSV